MALLATGGIAFVWWMPDASYQERNLRTTAIVLGAGLLLGIWWLFFSRARWKVRLLGIGLGLISLGVAVSAFRIRGVSGDLVPILEWRWTRKPAPPERQAVAPPIQSAAVGGTSTLPAFPQFLGPDRTGILSGPALDRDWTSRPPRLLWLRPVGAAWSGFAVSEGRAVTQEQDGENELVTCYELFTGRRLWSHSYAARYFTTIAGEGPRATPTLANGRVYTLGATGVLTCLELESGRALWSRNIAVENGANVPEWGLSGSPLVDGDRVVVSAGGPNGKSLVAYRIEGGAPLWSGGDDEAGYGSPALALLAGRQQILAFNRRRITAHDADAGRVLWEYPWGRGFPHVAVPVAVSSNTVLFSSGYGVGSELLRIDVRADGSMAAERVWKSIRMKAKFNNPLAYRGHLYGLDDGVLACIDLADGSQKWKEGRYGHGQVLLVGETLLVTSETGEILLVDPTPEAHRVLARHRVFQRKTWNPPALVGKVLLVRNDAEAACLELPLAR